jgi:type IV secretion system protein VirB8
MRSFVPSQSDYDSYFKAGATWEDETHRILRRSRSLAWAVTAVFGVIAGASLLALNVMLPLKQFEPYVIAVDKTTGFIEVARALKPGALSENEAVTTANLVRYVRARETYDPRALKDNYDLAQLYSTAMASAELERDFEPSNPNSKDKLFGRETKIEVTVKSVSFLNKNTATVRLQTITKRQNTAKTEDWVSVIRFRYTTSPLKNEYRFDNPLGFQVTDYRRDQESLPDAPSARDVSP